MQRGPLKFGKMRIGSRAADFKVHGQQPIILVSTHQSNLQTFYLQALDKNGVQTKPISIRQYNTQCVPQLISFSNSNIVHCEQSLLKINNKEEILQQDRINHLLTDEKGLALTSCRDSMLISSVHKAKPLGQLHFYGSNISSLFWNNSLVGSGDKNGMVNLWDINKQSVLRGSLLHNAEVDIISAYVDFIHTNIYYTGCKKQNKITFHDLRSYKPINIVSNLAKFIDIQHNKSGKIFILSEQKVQLIDIYHSFSIFGHFNQVEPQHALDQQPNHLLSSDKRNMSNMLIWDNYLIVGCSNGCIEVYNSDTLKCSYGYGVCDRAGVKTMHRLKDSLIVLDQNGMFTSTKLK